MPRPLFIIVLILSVAWPVHGDQVDQLLAEAAPPARFAGINSHFTVTRQSFAFSEGNDREHSFWVIRDHDRCVAVLHDRMWQLDIISFDPTRTPPAGEPPSFKSFYSWGTLLGVRITAAAWYPHMYPSGRVAVEFSEPGDSLTITTVQTWPSPLDGSSTYAISLRCDPMLGYVWDMTTDFAVREPARNNKGEVIRPEFFNWQVGVTRWTQRHNQRWPAEWDHERTVFTAKDGRLVGFYLNPEANDRNRFIRTEVEDGGFVAKLPGPRGWGVALVHKDKASFSTPNSTCNMWGDQHNYLSLPESPDVDGMFRVRGAWRFLALPPEVVNHLLPRIEMDNTGREG
jgi:hypothetical protein